MSQIEGKESSIEGIRALTHLSLIALHSSMILTAHLPSQGLFWQGIKKHLVYTAAQAGGVQVDIMFMLTGYLMIAKLLKRPEEIQSTSYVSFVGKRAFRLLPCILAVSLCGYIVGDSWDAGGVPAYVRILATALFFSNYLPASIYGSFTLSLVWSCCVDIQVTLFLLFLVKTVSWIVGSSNSRLLKALKVIFGLLVIVSVGIRASLFEESSINLFKLGQYSHFGLLMDDLTRQWVESYYNHTWHSDNSAVQLSMKYMDNMYMPTHTRCGPYFVGAFLACCVFTARRDVDANKAQQQQQGFFKWVFGFFLCWVFTLLALTASVTPCLPADDEVPVEGQFFATAALRTLAATSVAFLLYRTMIPPSHGWHWPLLQSFLSLSIWQPIGDLSYCSYLIHFRILMELALRETSRQMFGLSLPNHFDAARISEWIFFLGKLVFFGTTVSMILSVFMRYLIEVPGIALGNKLFGMEKRVKSL